MFIISHVIRAMQIMSVTQPDTFSNALLDRNMFGMTGKHITEVHGGSDLLNEGCFKVLKKCQSKFDCFVVFEKLYIKRPKPNLNVQTASMRSKLYGLEFKLFIFNDIS